MKPLESELEKAFKQKEHHRAVEVVSKMRYFKNIDERLENLQLKFNLENV